MIWEAGKAYFLRWFSAGRQAVPLNLQLEQGAPNACMSHLTFLARHVIHAFEERFHLFELILVGCSILGA